ncbi:MAG: hypothetical protein FJ403_11600 [Verrucomicrobia bacterium]|nr:hypothetical protein [Verrucomicrobiota bacterium]
MRTRDPPGRVPRLYDRQDARRYDCADNVGMLRRMASVASEALLFADMREQLLVSLVQLIAMPLKQSFQVNSNDLGTAVARKLLAVVAGFLAVAFVGCDKSPGPPPPQPQPSVRTAQAQPSARAEDVPAAPAPQRVETVAAPNRPVQSPELPAESKLPFYELRMRQNDLMAMERGWHSNETPPATFVADGEIFEGVKVGYRGAFARSWSKKPLKIFFNKDKLFQGKQRINLNSCWRDAAYIREHLAYEIYAACGAPASKTHMCASM